MRIRRVEFLRSALRPEDFPRDNLPEVAFAGRSNVGKSSLLNTLWGRRGLARTSSTPGRTRTINFYLLEGAYYFVDLPGYGFAKVPLRMRREWAKGLEDYFRLRRNLRGVVVVMDARHGPTALDHQMFEWLKELGIEAVPVFTKVDKASQKEKVQARRRFEQWGLSPDEPLFFSARTGEGKDRLWSRLWRLLKAEAACLKE